MNDLMTPSASPGGSGVRRVNNVPIIIFGAALMAFLLVMAMVAVHRSKAKAESVNDTPKVGNSKLMADTLTNGWQGGFIQSKAPPMPENVVVPIAHVDLSRPPAPPTMLTAPAGPQPQDPKDRELERIRQLKLAAFEEAVKSPTSGPASLAGFRAESDKKSTAAPSVSQPNADRWKLSSRPEPPETKFVLRTGFVIPAVMVSGINSQLAGPVIAQVSQPVYDTATGKYLLVPQGTRIFGQYSNDVVAGQERVLVAWQRLIFPDGKAMDIGEMPGTDGAGLAGLSGDVNNHYLRIFGHALLMSLITAAATYSQQPSNWSAPGSYGYQQTATGTLSAALGQQLGAAGTAVLMKNLNIAPTIEVHAGYRLNVIATKDLTFDTPYRPFAK